MTHEQRKVHARLSHNQTQCISFLFAGLEVHTAAVPAPGVQCFTKFLYYPNSKSQARIIDRSLCLTIYTLTILLALALVSVQFLVNTNTVDTMLSMLEL